MARRLCLVDVFRFLLCFRERERDRDRDYNANKVSKLPDKLYRRKMNGSKIKLIAAKLKNIIMLMSEDINLIVNNGNTNE